MPDDSGVEGWLVRSWYGARSRPWLAPLAWLFALYAGVRRLAYRAGLLARHHPGVPVIIIGNLTTGGTGKTPLVLWLAAELQRRGIAPGVVLRGHGGSALGPMLVGADSDPAVVGDEAVLLARRAGCQVAVGRNRVAAARLLVQNRCTAILGDDGLQHLALQRDMEIIVVDGARGLGNGALLPQGPLRESARRLRTADAVVINGVDSTGVAARAGRAFSMEVVAGSLRTVAADQPVALESLQRAEVHAVAGIGNPQRFFALLRHLGCRPVEHAFADHHPFTPADLAFADQRLVVMTEKDAVKCRAFATERMLYLQVSAAFPVDDAGRLMRLVEGCLSKGERIHA